MKIHYPETIRIDLTGRCNLKCKHCQASMFTGKRHQELSTLQWKNVFKEMAAEGAITLGFLGGEPFIRGDFIELLIYAKELGLRTTVTTNGTVLTEEIIKQLVDQTNTFTVFSLDGPNSYTHDSIRGSGSFDKTLKAINLFSVYQEKKEKSLLGISSVLHKNNITNFCDIFDTAIKLRAQNLSIAVVHKGGRAINNWHNLEVSASELVGIGKKIAHKASLLRKDIEIRLDIFPASYRDYLSRIHEIDTNQDIRLDVSGVKECYVQPDGRVFPSQICSEMLPEVLLGAKRSGIEFNDNSLKNKSFGDIWNGVEFSRFRNLLLSRQYVASLNPCNTCRFSGLYCYPSISSFFINNSHSHPLCEYVNSIES
ncbi:radical SAM protein [Prosthecochloris sp. GSB1]|uniref:radical SAM protein n=1 Tax=Prosthecochloris sp. GSB1 TaxID=281093 RepID=UPI00142E01A7|nr:radical SAM protein [Prosthecochloris sp. GSB1]